MSICNITYAIELKQDIMLFVAPDGNDADNGSITAPFASMDRAKEAVRKLKGDSNIIVYFRGGEYSITKPIEFDNRDSGSAARRITYSAYQNEIPIFNAGVKIENWEPYKDGIWKSSLKNVMSFRNLYVNGGKTQRGRYPNVDEYLKLPADPTETGYIIEKGIIENIKNYQDSLEIGINVEWMSKKMRISKFEEQEKSTKITINPIEWEAINKGPQGWKILGGNVYWLENALQFVDSEGEWFLDKSTNTVYYYPRKYEDMKTANVFAGGLESIIKINGTSASRISNIAINGIKFIGTGWIRPDTAGFVDVQANSIIPVNMANSKDSQYRHTLKKEKMPGAIHIFYGDDIEIKDCEFTNIAAGAIVFEEGGRNINIENNKLTDIGGNGIEVSSDYYKAMDKNIFHKAVTIKNNYLENVANEYYGGVGILAYYVTGLTIENNWVKNASYSGISAGWGWAAQEAVDEAKDYIIRNNRVEDYMRRLRDGGGIYVTNPISGENIIEGNYLIGNPNCFLPTSGTVGIYHDGAAANWKTRRNVIEMFRLPLSLQTVKGQEAKNIEVTNNFTAPNPIDPKDPKIAEKNIILKDNIAIKKPIWGKEAQDIINNAGLVDKGIVPSEEVEANIKSFYRDIGLNDSNIVDIEIKNNGQEKDIVTQLQLPKGVSTQNDKIESFKQGETKNISIEFFTNDDTLEGYYIVPVFIKWGNGYYLKREIGLNIVNSLSTIIGVSDSGYTEDGSFEFSGLGGYNGTTRYGYSKGASAKWTMDLKEDGDYKVSIYVVSHASSDKEAKINVVYDGGTSETIINYNETPSGWYELGTFPFKKGKDSYVKNTKSDNDKTFLRTSAVSFVPIMKKEQKEKYALENGIKKIVATAVFRSDKDYCFVNQIKLKNIIKPVVIDGNLYIDAHTLSNILGAKYIENNDEVRIVKGTRGIRIVKGNDYIELNKIRFETSKIDGDFIIQSNEILKQFGYYVNIEENGLITITNESNSAKDMYAIKSAYNAFVD
jgi:hypothetical protein